MTEPNGRNSGAPLAGPVRVSAGLHVVVVIKDGETQLKKQVRVMGGRSINVSIDNASDNSPANDTVPPPSPPEDSRPPLKTIGIGLTAGGATLLVASIITGSIALSTNAELEKECPDKQCTSQTDLDLRDRVKGLKIATDVLWPTGLATAACGLAFIILSAKGRERVSGLILSPGVAGRQGGIILSGSF